MPTLPRPTPKARHRILGSEFLGGPGAATTTASEPPTSRAKRAADRTEVATCR
jgi:hypothetical protein